MGLLARAARVLVRVAGWLVTPVAALIAAALGATIAAVVAPRFSPMTGVWIMAGGGLVGAIAGLWAWLRLLRGSPQLQEALAVTPEGVPRQDAIDEIMTGEAHHPRDPAP